MSDLIKLENGELSEELAAVAEGRRREATSGPAAAPAPPADHDASLKNAVSGCYRAAQSGYEIELRVDIDGDRPCQRVSTDYYRVSGNVKAYYGSQKSNAVNVNWDDGAVTIDGDFDATFVSPYRFFKVTIPRTAVGSDRAAATITYFNASAAQGRTYVCAFDSPFFRTVRLEHDRETGTALFESYDTGTLPHGGAARRLDVVSAYAEAGIQIVPTTGANFVPVAAAGVDSVWTNAELEAAMHAHFSIVADAPQWQVYLLSCRSRHEFTSANSYLYGIMFDYTNGVQRQGCAVFQSEIDQAHGGPGSSQAARHTLYCHVHEIGHAFNLLHSWDKGRPDALSWMNYDYKYEQRNGFGSYWANFGFGFDPGELEHLRHAFRNHVIMGGDAWATNFGYVGGENPVDITQPVVVDRSGLRLALEPAKATFAFGEPVVVQLELQLAGSPGAPREKVVNARLHPNYGFVQVVIRKPGGETVVYQPLAEHLTRANTITLNAATPSIKESVYIGYGRAGHYFGAPGTYLVKAAYHTPEGGIITTETVKIRIRSPLSLEEDQIAEVYLGEEQGRLFYLLGSDGAHLQKANDQLTEVRDRHRNHPLAVYAMLVQGVNASRTFKRVGRDKRVVVRECDPKQAGDLIDKVLELTSRGVGVDDITLSYAVRQSATCNARSGDKKTAEDSLSALLRHLEGRLPDHQMRHARQQVARVCAKENLAVPAKPQGRAPRRSPR